MCIETLRAEGIEPALYWFNPNIHPYKEYESRRDALAAHAASVNCDLIMEDAYGLREFVAGLAGVAGAAAFDRPARCAYCYRTRLEKTAQRAKERGFASFSTTLLISPYQDHDLLKRTAEEAAAKYDVGFLYRDFRPYFREGQGKARAAGYYMQKYCGCVFSEEERYRFPQDCSSRSASYTPQSRR
jgi:predicted adenine nucleotide alpha hydrolase (AANH) superfamily ATPase